jgi:hypothetical protein
MGRKPALIFSMEVPSLAIAENVAGQQPEGREATMLGTSAAASAVKRSG